VIGQAHDGPFGPVASSAIDNLLAIATVSSAITHAVVDAVAAERFAGSQIAREPWVGDRAGPARREGHVR
jgi:hypothetical protein